MTSLKPHLITEDGLVRLKADLEQMQTSGREKVAERLHQAFQDGQDDDFVDNAELEAARNAQAFLEGRIIELEDIIKNHQIIEENNDGIGFIRVGSRIVVSENGYDEQEKYHLVGAAEADPVEGRISNESPLGQALLGAKVGDIVRVNAPNGVLEFEVVKIE
ncbi:MAG: transcription elongation factor GreA [Chloroflexi bacterium]|nr:transcription elongation factor GreA [Chloroflexota bacterium]